MKKKKTLQSSENNEPELLMVAAVVVRLVEVGRLELVVVLGGAKNPPRPAPLFAVVELIG